MRSFRLKAVLALTIGALSALAMVPVGNAIAERWNPFEKEVTYGRSR